MGVIKNCDRPSGNGKQRGRQGERQDAAHAVQAVAASAVAIAVPAILPPAVSFVVQAQPGAFSDGRAQDGTITLM